MTNKKYRTNYHTHCMLCNHAKGTIEDYVKKAIEIGLDEIGISDHAPFNLLETNLYRVRMYEHEYPKYLSQLNDAIKKYSDQIKIYRGLEIEYFDEYVERYYKLNNELDYLILGQHYIDVDETLKSIYKLDSVKDLYIYKDTVIKAMSTNQFKIFAHPDIFLYNHGAMEKEVIEICNEIIEAAIKYDVVLEFNANGIRRKKYEVREDGQSYKGYPREDFWKLVAQTNAKVIIGADAHAPSQLKDNAIDEAYKITSNLSIVVEEELVFN